LINWIQKINSIIKKYLQNKNKKQNQLIYLNIYKKINKEQMYKFKNYMKMDPLNSISLY